MKHPQCEINEVASVGILTHSLPTLEQLLGYCSADQLLIYHELAKPLAGGKPLRLEFLTKTQQPAIELYDIAPAPQRLDRMRRTVEQVWRAIEAGHFYPAPSPFICPGCPYRESCQAWS